MSSIEEIQTANMMELISYNRKAVTLYGEGDYKQAKEVLLVAISFFRVSCCMPSYFSALSFNNNNSSFQEGDLSKLYEQEEIFSVIKKKMYSRSPENQPIDLVQGEGIYNAAFLITHLSQSEIAAVLFFNLGLLYHQIGLKSGKTKELKAALRLYTQSQSSFGQQSWILHSSPTLVLLNAALCHNIMQVHVAVADFVNARFMMHNLFVAVHCIKMVDHLVDKNDLTFFLLSSQLLELDPIQNAPAA